jgi:hypothetical protein
LKEITIIKRTTFEANISSMLLKSSFTSVFTRRTRLFLALLAFCCSAQTPPFAVSKGLNRSAPALFTNTAKLDATASPVEASPNNSAIRSAEQQGTVSVPIPMTDVIGLVQALSQINNSIANINGGNGLTIPMSNVTGLLAALAQINDSVDNLTKTVAAQNALINSLTSTVQNLPSVPTFVDSETPVGLIDGVNPTFALSAAPSPPTSLIVYRNGLRLTPGSDYSLSGNIIVFTKDAIPNSGDLITVTYRLK